MLFSPQCSTVNFFYGAKIITDTGIVLNNEMDDFSSPGISSGPLPPSNVNFVRPGKRPLSSTCPTIAVMVISISGCPSYIVKGLSTPEGRRGHVTPHMPGGN